MYDCIEYFGRNFQSWDQICQFMVKTLQDLAIILQGGRGSILFGQKLFSGSLSGDCMLYQLYSSQKYKYYTLDFLSSKFKLVLHIPPLTSSLLLFCPSLTH